MSNSMRFEFYNNFDIWYDLYQENGGDPNHIINMMMYMNQNIFKKSFTDVLVFRLMCELENNFINENGNANIYGCGYLVECINGFGEGYRNRLGDGYGYIYGVDFISGDEIEFINGNGTI